MKALLVALLVFGAAAPALAQTPIDLRATRTATPPKIDGDLLAALLVGIALALGAAGRRLIAGGYLGGLG